jgi:hypothetical protein
MRRKTLNFLKKIKYAGSAQPVSRVFGFDRGLPIDRYYIEKFLDENRVHIRGRVLEIGDSRYTKKFGDDRVERSLILHATYDNPKADIVADLATGENIPENLVDCFIMTQTLVAIYDIHSAVYHSVRMLRSGGVLLCSVSGITQISRYDMDRWGHYWSFTDLSLRKIFEEVVPSECIKIKTYGNVKAAAAFLYGLSADEIGEKTLDFIDSDYQVTIAAVVTKE